MDEDDDEIETEIVDDGEPNYYERDDEKYYS